VPAVAAPAQPKLRSVYAGDPDMQEIIGKFISELPGRVTEIEDLLLSHDFETLRRVVHQLKGAGGGYGFGEITTCAAEAERAIKTPGSIEQIERDVKSLIGLIQRVDGFSAITKEEAHAAKTVNH
jgi:HPt (histidine-containing phosphotransfer) domain-containing protein